MAERNSRNVFVLGANIREDFDEITKTERMVRNGGGGGFGGRPDASLPSFEDLRNRLQDFQKLYNSSAGAELKIWVLILNPNLHENKYYIIASSLYGLQ